MFSVSNSVKDSIKLKFDFAVHYSLASDEMDVTMTGNGDLQTTDPVQLPQINTHPVRKVHRVDLQKKWKCKHLLVHVVEMMLLVLKLFNVHKFNTKRGWFGCS